MKHHLVVISTAVAIGWTAPVIAQDNIDDFLNGIEAMIESDGPQVNYDARNIGSDGSIEFVGFNMGDDDATITADWIMVVPSASVPGSITVTLSPNARFAIHDGEVDVVVDIANSGLVINADGVTSGQGADTLNYSIVADSLSITSNDPDNQFLRGLDITLTDLNEAASFSPSTMLLTNTGSITFLKMMYDFTTPDAEQMSSDGVINNVSHSLRVIADDNDEHIAAYFSGAETAFFTFDASSSQSAAEINSDDITLDYHSSAGASHVDLRAENGVLTYDVSINGTDASINQLVIEGTPLPAFDLSMDELKMLFSLPTATSDVFEQAKLMLALRNVSVSESLLGMVDPGQIISRDPMNFIVDVSANVKSRVNWDDPDSSFDSGNPADIGEIQDVSINEILITAGGAEITADGNATIDNSMGFPFPVGAVTVVAKGVQGLVNGLVQLGLVPQNEAGMAMGMMMAFARPGSAADEFISDIEFSPQGVTANGVPLPF